MLGINDDGNDDDDDEPDARPSPSLKISREIDRCEEESRGGFSEKENENKMIF
jgi:hypothetical protein